MSSNGRHHRNGAGNISRESTPVSGGFMLVTSPDQQSLSSAEPHKPMAALQNSGIDVHQSLLCTETLPSSTPPAHEAQLPAQASTPVHHTWTKAHLPAANDVQFALIVPETFLASNQHLLARATLVGSTGEDVGGAAGAVVAVRAADIGVASVVRQDESGGHKLISAPTLLREVVSLTPGTSVHSVVNGLDGTQKVVSSSAILVPAVSGGDPSHQHLARLAEVAVQQAHVLSPTQGQVSSPSPVSAQSQAHQEQQQQSSPPASPASEGMHSGRPGTGSGHSQGHAPPSTSQEQPLPPHAMLSAGASAGPSTGLGVFRGGSLTHGEPMSRVVGVVGSGGSQYSGGVGNSASSSMSPYPSLYNVHGQSSPLPSVSPYPTFFSQYPAAAPPYAPASLVASPRFPHIESYSAVLASMGSHIQHGSHASPQSQTGTRAPYLPSAIGQYSHRSLSASSSPGPSSHSPSGPSSSFSMREREAMLQQGRERDRDRSPLHQGPGLSSSSPPDDKGVLHSPGLHYSHRSSPGGLMKEMKGDPRDPFQKVPSGKEGSLKHRILTRPPDMGPESAAYGHAKGRSQSLKVEEELPSKRTKYMTPSLGAPASASSPTDPHVFLAPHALGPGPPHSAGHYLHHSTTNSTTPSPTSPATTSPTSSASRLTRTPESGPSPGGSSLPPHLHYPPHFIKGSIIQLANGDLKRVEDLQTEDFVSSAQVSADLKVDSSTVVRIEEHPELGTATLGFSVGEHRVQVTVEATLEHPFFVFGQGWSSCSSERTLQRYGLDCHKLSVGDVCISLTHKDVSLRAAEIVSQQQQQQQTQPPDVSSRLMGDAGKDHHSREHGQDSKGAAGQRESSQEPGHVQDNGLSGSGTSDSSSKVVDLSKSREGGGSSRPLTHARSTEGHMTSQPSTSDHSSPPDSRPPRKRRWSAPESDVEKEKMELEKQNSGPSQNE